MIANLRNATEVQLREFVRDILATPRSLTAINKIDLRAINDEFMRRDAMKASQLCHYCHQPFNGGPRCSNCGSL